MVDSKLQNPPWALFKTGLDLFFIHFTFKNTYSVHVAYGSSKDAKLGISGSNSPPRQWSNSPIPQHKWWWNAWLGNLNSFSLKITSSSPQHQQVKVLGISFTSALNKVAYLHNLQTVQPFQYEKSGYLFNQCTSDMSAEATSFPGFSSTLPYRERERERET